MKNKWYFGSIGLSVNKNSNVSQTAIWYFASITVKLLGRVGSDCCLMPIQQFFSYIMARTCYFSMRWWWGPFVRIKKGEHVHVSTTVCPMHGSYMDFGKVVNQGYFYLVFFNFTRKIRYSTFILFTRDYWRCVSLCACIISAIKAFPQEVEVVKILPFQQKHVILLL